MEKYSVRAVKVVQTRAKPRAASAKHGFIHVISMLKNCSRYVGDPTEQGSHQVEEEEHDLEEGYYQYADLEEEQYAYK